MIVVWDGGWCKVLVLVLVFEAGARCAANPRLSRAGRMLKMAEAGRGRSRFFETEVSGKSQLWGFYNVSISFLCFRERDTVVSCGIFSKMLTAI